MADQRAIKSYWYLLGILTILQYILAVTVIIVRIQLDARATNIEGLAYLLLVAESFLLGMLLKANQSASYIRWMRVINISLLLVNISLFSIALYGYIMG